MFSNTTIELIAEEIARKKWVMESSDLNTDEKIIVTIKPRMYTSGEDTSTIPLKNKLYTHDTKGNYR